MNFAELKASVIGTTDATGSAFPQGPPENLLTLLAERLAEGMFVLQRHIPCYQQRHIDVYPSCSLMFQNGASVLTKPAGEILRVYTIGSEAGGWDAAIPYTPVTLPTLRRWMAKFRRNARWVYRDNRIASGEQGFIQPSATLDSPGGRAGGGVYSIDPHTQRLIVGPWLQSTEKLVVEWRGIKKEWRDTDLVPDDPAFKRLIRLWLTMEYGRDFASPDLQTRERSFREEHAEQIIACDRENQINGDIPDDSEAASAEINFEANPPADAPEVRTSTRICFVGDTGTANAAAASVAAAVIAQNPDYVVLLGDAVYSPATVEEALAPYQSFIDAHKLVVALGNHDLDLGLTTVAEAVGNPGNGRYFSVELGPVTLVIANSGMNTAGTVVETDGNFAGSPQWVELQSIVARSCARWKFLCLHHAPYSSGSRYAPGVVSQRWASNMEVNAVLSGHSHNYERGTFLNRLHFVVGTGGGSPQDGFESTPEAGSEVRITDFGFLMVDATSTSAVWKFIDTDGTVRDTVTKTDELGPSIPVGPTPGTPPTVTQFEEYASRDEMLASTKSWQHARVTNWDPGDGIITEWSIVTDPAVIPNGTDVRMTVLGRVIYRTFVREGGSDVIVPPPPGEESYQASAVIGFPTYADLTKSRVSCTWVLAFDSRGQTTIFKRDDTSTVHDGVDNVVNAAGIHYKREGFV